MKKTKSLSLILGIFLTLDVLKFQASAADRLPDLAMMKLRDLNIENTPDGRRLLRFTTIIINIGVGKFELWGQRANTSDPLMSVSQRIFDDAGGYRDRPTTAVMYYAGDGHTHWHIKNLENYALIRLDNGAKVGTEFLYCAAHPDSEENFQIHIGLATINKENELVGDSADGVRGRKGLRHIDDCFLSIWRMSKFVRLGEKVTSLPRKAFKDAKGSFDCTKESDCGKLDDVAGAILMEELLRKKVSQKSGKST